LSLALTPPAAAASCARPLHDALPLSPYSLAGFDVEGWARALGADVVRADGPDAFRAAAARALRGPLVLVVPIDPESRGRRPGRQIGRAHSELQSLTNLVCRLLLEKTN